jgi:hypothetical protein
MKQYKVFIHGTNFLVKFSGQPKKVGFYTTRFVRAANAEAAVDIAVQMLRDQESLRESVLNKPSDRPQLHVEKMFEADLAGDEPEPRQVGLVWYAEDGTDLTQLQAAPSPADQG